MKLSNDTELIDLALDGVHRIELHFPKFSDGRAFSQTVTLRRRLGFKGELRATGDVLVDQVLCQSRYMTTRCSAVLDSEPPSTGAECARGRCRLPRRMNPERSHP